MVSIEGGKGGIELRGTEEEIIMFNNNNNNNDNRY